MDTPNEPPHGGKKISLAHALDLLVAGVSVQERMGQRTDFERRLPDLLLAFHQIVQSLDDLRIDWRRALSKDARLAVLIPLYVQWEQKSREAAANVVEELTFAVFTSPFARETKLVAKFFQLMEQERALVRLDVSGNKATFSTKDMELALPARAELDGTIFVNLKFLAILRDFVRDDEWIECYASRRCYRVGSFTFSPRE